MLGINNSDNKNLKDTSSLSNLRRGQGEVMSYTKTYKLITALYMVTDIIDSGEPLRSKLRTSGLEILSDTSTMSKTVFDIGKIDQVMSFLNIASAMNFISQMNCAILQKEFLELKSSIQESIQVKPLWLEEFLSSPPLLAPISPHPSPLLVKERGSSSPKGHTRIGVQKGSTLMQALSDKITDVGRHEFGRPTSVSSKAKDFEILKKQRREDIIDFIKKNGGNATIKDIKNKSQGHLISCSEKTLQRELMSMTKDGVLKKMGEKRWSRYFLK